MRCYTECSWCHKSVFPADDPSVVDRLDAAGIKHWFHLACWRKHLTWLRQWDFHRVQEVRDA